MPEVSWRSLMRERPAAHLVVGVIPKAGRDSAAGSVKFQLGLLACLVMALRLGGKYALTDIRDRYGNQIQCALADPDDAARLANALGAIGIGRYPGWASHHSFRFDDALTATVKAALARRPAGRRSLQRRLLSMLHP